MASYQDIEGRLRVIEDKVSFLMKAGRGRLVIETGMVGPDNRPLQRIQEASLEDLYLALKVSAPCPKGTTQGLQMASGDSNIASCPTGTARSADSSDPNENTPGNTHDHP